MHPEWFVALQNHLRTVLPEPDTINCLFLQSSQEMSVGDYPD